MSAWFTFLNVSLNSSSHSVALEGGLQPHVEIWMCSCVLAWPQEGHKKGIEPEGYNPGCVSFILGILGSSVFCSRQSIV